MTGPRVGASGGTWRFRLILCAMLAIVLALLLEWEPTQAQESEHYKIEILSVSSVAEQAASARFDLLATIAETEPAGTTSFCNGGYAASLGFLSVFGEAPVANLLFVKQNQVNPAHLELDWSGSAPSFEVYRHLSAATLVDPAHLLTTTTDCFLVDTDPPVGQVVYYTVLPAAE